MKQKSLYRVLDANLNRLREGIRVVEEVFRFISEEVAYAEALKKMRHSLQVIENELGHELLLEARDSDGDMFSQGTLGQESQREDLMTLVRANLRRAQEAARVLEEFLKMSVAAKFAEEAKRIRFQLYTIEKEWKIDA